jgi:hypothetical protein
LRSKVALPVLTAVLALFAMLTPPPAVASATPAPVTVTGLDLHDGMILRHDGRYFMYGTRYGCGFRWKVAGTPFCGFGVATAERPAGPWTFRRLLFFPKALDNWGPDKGKTWNWICGSDGAGCYNPRMLHRPDGVWVLWFNAPRDSFVNHANAYYAMGCNGPQGPCGYQAGKPHGSTHKPALTVCDDDGDFSIVTSGASAAIICSQGALSEERLTSSWTDGTGRGSTELAGVRARPAAAVPAVAAAAIGEGVGAFRLPDSSWEMVYSSPGCGYCTGPPALLAAGGANTQVQAGYATAPSMLGPWTAQGVLSPGYCTGQPRTAFTLVGQSYEWVDRWTGSVNETSAPVLLEPMAAVPWACA